MSYHYDFFKQVIYILEIFILHWKYVYLWISRILESFYLVYFMVHSNKELYFWWILKFTEPYLQFEGRTYRLYRELKMTYTLGDYTNPTNYPSYTQIIQCITNLLHKGFTFIISNYWNVFSYEEDNFISKLGPISMSL